MVGSEIYDTTGESGELAHLKSMAAQSSISEKFLFLPFQKDVVPVYRDLDILVHGSIRPEPFGRVLVEGMMCGLPVVASDQGGPLEIITNRKNGLLYRQGSVEDMASKVQALIDNPSLCKSLRENAPEYR